MPVHIHSARMDQQVDVQGSAQGSEFLYGKTKGTPPKDLPFKIINLAGSGPSFSDDL